MEKHMCDICEVNESELELTAWFRRTYLTFMWKARKFELCDACYQKLVRVNSELTLNDELKAHAVNKLNSHNYSDKEKEVYLQAYDDICDLLITNKIMKMQGFKTQREIFKIKPK